MRRHMRKVSVMTASMLVLSGGMLASVTRAQSPMVNGQVTKIDESAGKITLRHGPIKKLDMNEGMTMVFRAQDPAMLKQVKVGDKVKFDADRINGQITVTKIEKAR
jgi:Cu(I)/Ag(I) efflux system periplasmic protein CusF